MNLTAFATYLKERDYATHSIETYCRGVAAFFSWLEKTIGQSVAPGEVTTFDLQRYRDYLLEVGYKPGGAFVL
jgi:site-specific recombinase XerD